VNWGGVFLVAAGVFTICAAAYDWEFFMGHPKAWLFVRILGRNGARVFYAALGGLLLFFGALMAFGVLWPQR
jgi:hypothetical protein